MASDSLAFGVLLLGGLAVVFALVFGAAFMVLRRTARSKEAQARERYPHARMIDRSASFFGQQSLGAAQMRGNGTLILTETDLIFERWLPARTFRIPLQSIQAIESPVSFLGKSRFTPLLKVLYLNEAGTPDAIAWQVRDLDEWIHLIKSAQA